MNGSPASALAGVALLDGAEPAQLATLGELLEPGSAPAGEVLGREGEAGETFWLVIDGTVRVTTRTVHGERLLATVGPGCLLGELALLRGGPRTATLTTATDSLFLIGRRPALHALVAIDAVRARMRRLASARLAADLKPVRTELRDGGAVLLRPLLPADRPALGDALQALSEQSVRRRFFSAVPPAGPLIDYLTDIDYVDHFAWTVLDATSHDGLAVARYVRPDPSAPAEMAFTTVDRHQGRGIATLLLGALGVAAVEAGVAGLEAVVMEDNRAMRAVFARAGGRARFAEPGFLHVDVEPAAAAALLDPGLRGALAVAVHDVVTAASLALT